MQRGQKKQRPKPRNLVRDDKPEMGKQRERERGKERRGGSKKREEKEEKGRARKEKQGKREQKRSQEKVGREAMRIVYNLFPPLVHYPVPGLQRISKATC